MKTFPVVRDLIVDREFMFDSLKKIKAWVPIDGTYDLGEGPRMPERKRQWAYELSKCMTCGVCLEACPNVNDKTNFMGPALLSQVRLFNTHPTGAMNKDERLAAIMDRWWNCGMWKLTKLCSCMSERNSIYNFNCCNEPCNICSNVQKLLRKRPYGRLIATKNPVLAYFLDRIFYCQGI